MDSRKYRGFLGFLGFLGIAGLLSGNYVMVPWLLFFGFFLYFTGHGSG
jgi:hypothetical protein